MFITVMAEKSDILINLNEVAYFEEIDPVDDMRLKVMLNGRKFSIVQTFNDIVKAAPEAMRNFIFMTKINEGRAEDMDSEKLDSNILLNTAKVETFVPCERNPAYSSVTFNYGTPHTFFGGNTTLIKDFMLVRANLEDVKSKIVQSSTQTPTPPSEVKFYDQRENINQLRHQLRMSSPH